jgi:hypothetical protein
MYIVPVLYNCGMHRISGQVLRYSAFLKNRVEDPDSIGVRTWVWNPDPDVGVGRFSFAKTSNELEC